MEEKNLFYKLNLCTGCQLCVMACALAREGVCGEDESLITVLTHPQFGTSLPMIEQACMWEECDTRCIQVCSPGVLRFVEKKDLGKMLENKEWNPVPVYVKEQSK